MNEELPPLIRAQLLEMLKFFQPNARVIFQLAPRDSRSYDSIMVGELRHAIEKPKKRQE